MKGLVLVHLGRREEGVETVKRGMRYDLMSHICWHVFGLIQKGEKNYEEALKSYNQALRFDKVSSFYDLQATFHPFAGSAGKHQYLTRYGTSARPTQKF